MITRMDQDHARAWLIDVARGKDILEAKYATTALGMIAGGVVSARTRFSYAQRVKIVPLDRMEGRVIDLHYSGLYTAMEYDVRYFHEGKEFKIRAFEDELEDS